VSFTKLSAYRLIDKDKKSSLSTVMHIYQNLFLQIKQTY